MQVKRKRYNRIEIEEYSPDSPNDLLDIAMGMFGVAVFLYLIVIL